MDVSAEAADVVVRESLQATEAAAKLTLEITKNVTFIRHHFEGYIASHCLMYYTDEHGNPRSYVDADLRYQEETAMLSAIFSCQGPIQRGYHPISG